jgi:phosphoglucosamine mutase
MKFGTSGIRGEYPTIINEALAKKLAYAINNYTKGKVAIAMDTRLSGPPLKKALIENLNNDVLDFGVVPTPVLCFGIKNTDASTGIMITASHNPAQDNGFKLWDENGMAFTRDKEEKIEGLMENYKEQEKKNIKIQKIDIIEKYKRVIKDKIKLKGNLKVLIDCGGGAAFGITPQLLEEYGYDVVKVNCEADGSFSARNPEPNSENLKKTAELVKINSCDIGIAHDGDADRVMAIDNKGNVVDFDKFLAFLSQNNNKIVVTVDTSMTVDNAIKAKIIRTKVGDVAVAGEIKKSNADFGGEPSGSYIFPEHGLWPDGVYGAFKILSLLEKDGRDLNSILNGINKLPFSRNKIDCINKEDVMQKLRQIVPKDCELNTIDGMFMKFKDSSVLIRPSGTQPIIRVNVEAKTEERLQSLQKYWLEKVEGVIKNG